MDITEKKLRGVVLRIQANRLLIEQHRESELNHLEKIETYVRSIIDKTSKKDEIANINAGPNGQKSEP